ncbi:Aldo/keto reductase [Dentipellis sp. KUC8613]|nr:Aldo/keto reductase [Dentipellis sp. KUC8613]
MSPSLLTSKSTVRLSSGFTIPVIGLGVFKNQDPKDACLAALHLGYRHIDSARLYENEKSVGNAVRESGIPRSEIFVTSKVQDLDGGYQGTLDAVDDSLKNFGLDYLDLYLVHTPLAGKEKRIAAWKALLAARDAGKIKTAGVSNYGVKHLEEIREAGLEMPAVNQVEIHPLCQQRDIVQWCGEHGIAIEAYAPLIRADFSNPVLQDISTKYQRGPAQILVRWSLQHGFIPLPKSVNPDRIKSNAQVFDFEISEADMKRLDALDRGKAGGVSWNPVDAE